MPIAAIFATPLLSPRFRRYYASRSWLSAAFADAAALAAAAAGRMLAATP